MPISRNVSRYSFSDFVSTTFGPGRYRISIVAQSGCAVTGHRQVNSEQSRTISSAVSSTSNASRTPSAAASGLPSFVSAMAAVSSSAMGGISLGAVTKVYPGGVKAVDEVSLEIPDGEFMVLVGPSGCGKSTLLRMIAGLEEVTIGTITIGDVDVTDMQPRQRDIAMVFQNYALYPHMSVRDNLGFGLKLRKVAKGVREQRVNEVAKTLGLEQLMDRKPGALSGGQRQRVAMGRAMVREPKAFLMDEPLSNLDAKLRVSMRAE